MMSGDVSVTGLFFIFTWEYKSINYSEVPDLISKIRRLFSFAILVKNSRTTLSVYTHITHDLIKINN